MSYRQESLSRRLQARWVFYDQTGRFVHHLGPDDVPHGLTLVGWPSPLTALFQAPDHTGYYLAIWHLGPAVRP